MGKSLSTASSSSMVRLYYPMPKFPSISVTGDQCLLNCKHCMGYYLKHMPNVNTPEKLKTYALRLEAAGGVGMLVSGGCTPQGKIPLDRFYSTLSWIKENTGLLLNLHTGLISESDAKKIAGLGVDFVSFDIVGSEETISGVYGLKSTVSGYNDSLQSLCEAGIKHIIPHICVGLDYGNIKGEFEAVKIAASIKPEVIVFISLIPTKNTPMENVQQPKSEDILKALAFTKQVSPSTELAIGCMRSKRGKTLFEKRAIDFGVTRMTLPSKSTVEYARSIGHTVMFLDGCCATPIELEAKLIR
jgi:uncharacterized radical SAM superfamily protein